jgi:hypothetical protein
MAKIVAAAIGGAFCCAVAFIVAIWPITIEVLGIPTDTRPAVIMFVLLLIGGRPHTGFIEQQIWDSVFWQSAIHVAIAGFLGMTGLALLATAAVWGLSGQDRPQWTPSPAGWPPYGPRR